MLIKLTLINDTEEEIEIYHMDGIVFNGNNIKKYNQDFLQRKSGSTILLYAAPAETPIP